jgi:hypothetical protein
MWEPNANATKGERGLLPPALNVHLTYSPFTYWTTTGAEYMAGKAQCATTLATVTALR